MFVMRGFRSSSGVTRPGSTSKHDCRSRDRDDRYSRRKDTCVKGERGKQNVSDEKPSSVIFLFSMHYKSLSL